MDWAALSAISVTIIAVVTLGVGAIALTLMRDVRRSLESLQRVLDLLDRDGRPALLAARSMAEDTGKTVAVVRAEVEQIVGASRELRTRVGEAAGALEERVRDLEVVLDVVQDEIEDTLLDVASVLRSTRRCASVARALKRVLLGGKR